MGSMLGTITNEESQKMGVLALDYFLKHREIVHKKVVHAQTATRKSIENLEDEHKNKDHENKDSFERYDRAWQYILDCFHNVALTDDDLSAIEKLLNKLPAVIKKIYNALVEKDLGLKKLISSISSDKYKRAVDFAKKIHSKHDPLSGLKPEEFYPKKKLVTESEEAQIFMPSQEITWVGTK